MTHFKSALQAVLDRTYGGKIAAFASAADVYGHDIGRLLKDEAPLTAEKLAKLLRAEGMTENDKHLLTQSAVRDFVGEDAYRAWFIAPQSENTLREDLGGPRFEGLFPLNPRAEQVLRYIVNHAHETDTSAALVLLGKFLELPPAEFLPPESQHLAMISPWKSKKTLGKNTASGSHGDHDPITHDSRPMRKAAQEHQEP